MITHFSSIRSKVWLCVLTALAGFFVSVLVGFYVNISQFENLSQLQESYWPLVSDSEEMYDTIQQQTEKYEDAFLLGEDDLAQQAIALQVKFIDLIDRLTIRVQKVDGSPVTVHQLLILKQNYISAMRLAVELRPLLSADELLLEEQEKIRHIGQVLAELQAQADKIAVAFNSAMVEVIEQNKQSALYNLLTLVILFLIGFIAAGLTVNWVAGKLLVAPLGEVLENVRRLETGQELEPPVVATATDEIGSLAAAFWGMGEKLIRTTVSKRYVDNIITNMSGGLVVLRPDLRIEKISQQTVKLFGYPEKELLGQPIDLLLSSGDDSIISSMRITELLSVGIVRDVEVNCVGKDGYSFPAHFSGSAMYDQDNELLGVIGIFTNITELKKAQNELIQMAHHDSLTGLPNRHLLFDRLEHTLQDAKRHNRTFAILYLDLDNFKEINDTLGHDAGDLVLKEVSNRLLKLLRSDDTVARMGGDEFLVILNALNGPDAAALLAKKIVDGIAEPFMYGAIEKHIHVSAGISVFPHDGTTIDTLIKKSDSAMYVAKKDGGSCFTRTE